MVVGVFVVGQFLEGYVLSPKLVGAKVGLHPVWLMFALIAFGYCSASSACWSRFRSPRPSACCSALRSANICESPIYTGRTPIAGRADDGKPGRHRRRRSRRSSRSRSITPKAWRARISSPARPTPRRWR